MKITNNDRIIFVKTVLLIFGGVAISIAISLFIKDLAAEISGALLALLLIGSAIADWQRRKNAERTKTRLLAIGVRVFPSNKKAFENFFSLYLNDQEGFQQKFSKLLGQNEGFNAKNLQLIEALYLFAESKKLIGVTDWKGEEEPGEIELFLEKLLKQPIPRANVQQCREKLHGVKLDDGQLIIYLLKAIDMDLLAIGYKLLFFEMKWDAYVYTAVPLNAFPDLTDTLFSDFHGTEKLST